jgi:hypothetical protein
MTFQKKPKRQRIAQSGHPGVERKGSRLVLKDFKEKKWELWILGRERSTLTKIENLLTCFFQYIQVIIRYISSSLSILYNV